jgi:hypothetical protein
LRPGTVKGKRYKKQGKPTDAEKAVVAAVVLDSPAEVTPQQVSALATALNRTPAAIKKLVQDARTMLVSSAGDYVAIHKLATEAALRAGDPKSLDVAIKASQWAIQNISADGARVVDKASTEPQGQRIFIGIKMGGMEKAVVKELSAGEVIDAQ